MHQTFSVNRSCNAKNKEGDYIIMLMKHRTDIDGIRAVAVTAVVIYHFFPNTLKFGYLGVDVFFVLSGFLITKGVLSQIDARSFSFSEFYIRRALRLLPALMVVLTATTALCFFVFLPSDLLNYSWSLLASLFYVANIYFWRDTHYFSPAADEKPLLHIWSLGVEEQFYLLFPLALFLFCLWARRRALLLIMAATIVSFALNLSLITIGGSTPAFYLLPTRAWEFGIGAIVAFITLEKTYVGLSRWAALIGLLMIMIALVVEFRTMFLHWNSLLVVIGAACIILVSAPPATPVGRVLAHPISQRLGLYSYSIYLWHWPVVVIPKYYLLRELYFHESMALIATCFVLAAVTFHLIEDPVRKRRVPASKSIPLILAGYGLISLLALGLISQQGYPDRFNAKVAKINESVNSHFRCSVADMFPFGASRACSVGKQENTRPGAARVVILGNSHAQMYAPLIAQIVDELGKGPTMLVPLNRCLPTVSVNVDKKCLDDARANLRAVEDLPNVSAVVLAHNWPVVPLVTGANERIHTNDASELARATAHLAQKLKNRGVEVVVVGPIPLPGFDLASTLGRSLAFGHDLAVPTRITTEKFLATYQPGVDLAMQQEFNGVRSHLSICGSQWCNYVIDDVAVFSDSNHVAEEALVYFRPEFSRALTEALR